MGKKTLAQFENCLVADAVLCENQMQNVVGGEDGWWEKMWKLWGIDVSADVEIRTQGPTSDSTSIKLKTSSFELEYVRVVKTDTTSTLNIHAGTGGR